MRFSKAVNDSNVGKTSAPIVGDVTSSFPTPGASVVSYLHQSILKKVEASGPSKGRIIVSIPKARDIRRETEAGDGSKLIFQGELLGGSSCIFGLNLVLYGSPVFLEKFDM